MFTIAIYDNIDEILYQSSANEKNVVTVYQV